MGLWSPMFQGYLLVNTLYSKHKAQEKNPYIQFPLGAYVYNPGSNIDLTSIIYLRLIKHSKSLFSKFPLWAYLDNPIVQIYEVIYHSDPDITTAYFPA